jgi:RimJ/RimL family protein N-acetyltransferase
MRLKEIRSEATPMSRAAPHKVTLCEVRAHDLAIFFEQERDPVAGHMAAFTGENPDDYLAFQRHWQRMSADGTIVSRTILYGDAVAGNIARYTEDGRGEVTYWLGRTFWGKGIASEALRLLLLEVDERPLYARAAADNAGSLRVLQKCGFTVVGRATGYAAARKAEIEEYLLILQ